MKWSRIVHWTAVHLVLVMIACTGIGIWWAFDDRSPIGEVTQDIDGPINVPQFGQFSLRRMICADKGFTALSQRAFINGVVYNVPIGDPGHHMAFSEGCSRQTEVVTIPHTLPPGVYRYQVVLQIKNNPLISISVRLPVVHLQILPDTASSTVTRNP